MKNSGSQKIAERYVSALFDVATKEGAVDAVEKDLRNLASVIKSNEDFRDFLNNPLLSRDAQAKIAENLLAQLGVHKLTAQFVALLARQKRLGAFSEMIALFLEQAATARGELSATLYSASKLSEKETGTIAEKLKKAFGKKILLSTEVDPALIGGVVLNIGSQQLDASIAGKLHRLKLALKAA